MDVLTGRLARIIFALPFIVFGSFHLMNSEGMAGMIEGWPAAQVLVIVAGLGMIAAAIAIIANIMARLASLLLALLLLIFIIGVHVPALGGEGADLTMVNLLKDISLMGGALMVAGLSKPSEPV